MIERVMGAWLKGRSPEPTSSPNSVRRPRGPRRAALPRRGRPKNPSVQPRHPRRHGFDIGGIGGFRLPIAEEEPLFDSGYANPDGGRQRDGIASRNAGKRDPPRRKPAATAGTREEIRPFGEDEIVSSVRQAGSMPLDESMPRVGFTPTIPFMPAGMRPGAGVSVPKCEIDDARRDGDRRA